MSCAPVLGAMSESRRCERTGLSIPECSCRPCCDALLGVCARPPPPPAAGAAVRTAGDFAAQMGISVPQLHEFARRQELSV
jgi:hypothetical protein